MDAPTSHREYRALVLGATGAVGSALVRELLGSERCTGITAFVRNASPALESLPGRTGKLVVKVVSMEHLGTDVAKALAELPDHSVAFCTLGIGQPRKVSPEMHWRVDVEYVTEFASACRLAGVEQFSLLTSVGANAKARSRYLRVKGAVEEAVRALSFPRVSFFRPSLLVTKEIRYGLQDRLTQALFPLISWMLPSRFHEITVEQLARAMRLDVERPPHDGSDIREYSDFMRLPHAP